MKKTFAVVLAAVLLAAPGFAQVEPEAAIVAPPPGMPAEIAAMLREIGPVIEGQRTGAAYAALHATEPFTDVIVRRNVKYGAHERQALDVFSPDDNVGGRPVLVFVYGGGFRGGSRHAEGSAFYDNISRWAALNGMVGVQIDYRLAPEFQYPSGVEDLELLVEWMKHNITVYGGDPEKIVLWGHSSGGSHVADFVAWHSDDGSPPVDGAILMSSYYQLDPTQPSVWAAYYGDDPSRYGEMASLPGLVAGSIPLLIVDAELDTEDAHVQAALLEDALRAAGKPVNRVHLPNHSHLSEGYSVGTADTSLSDPVKAFVMEVTAD